METNHNKNRIIYFDTIDSTNKYALKNIDSLEDGVLITAGCQTCGKGRNNKEWHSPKTNIYASYILKPEKQILLQTSWIGGLSALKTLKTIPDLNDLWIKWPNDIFCNNKKICGVLCESKMVQDNKNSKTAVVIGIGMNINCTKNDLAEIPKACTSVLIETKTLLNLERLTTCLHENLNFYYSKIINSGIEQIYNEWKSENKLLGEKIIVEMSPDNIFELKVLDIDKNGAVIGCDNEGNIRTVYSGDVSIKGFFLKNYYKNQEIK